MGGKMERWKDRQMEGKMGRQTNRQRKDRWIDGQTDGQTEKQTDRQRRKRFDKGF